MDDDVDVRLGIISQHKAMSFILALRYGILCK